MAITHDETTRNELAQLVCDRVDAGTAYATSLIVIFATDGTVCAQGACSNPTFGAVASGVALANTIADDASPVAGKTPIRFEWQNRDRVAVIRGNVGENGDWHDSGAPIDSDQPFRFAGAFYRAPY